MAGCSGAAPRKSEGFLLKAALLYRSFVTRKKDLELMFLLTVAGLRDWFHNHVEQEAYGFLQSPPARGEEP